VVEKNMYNRQYEEEREVGNGWKRSLRRLSEGQTHRYGVGCWVRMWERALKAREMWKVSQKSLLIGRFARRTFVYSRKIYCGNMCALRVCPALLWKGAEKFTAYAWPPASVSAWSAQCGPKYRWPKS
jgi:hypothetical protein